MEDISCSEGNEKLAQWYTPVMPAVRKWRWEDQEFKVSLGYMISLRGAWACISVCVSVSCLCVCM